MTITVHGMPAPKRQPNGTFFRVHGLAIAKNPIYVAWKSIRRRCCVESSSDYKHYGARGIRLFQQWVDSPQAFVQYVSDTLGEKPAGMSIDRINNDGNYEPGNIRWADRVAQQNNKRSNHLITHEGVTRTVQEWAMVTGIKRSTIRWRSSMGMPSEDILSTADRRRN